MENTKFRYKLLGCLAVLLCIVWSIAGINVANAAPVTLSDDVIALEVQCANGRSAPAAWGCPDGQEYVEPSQFDYSLTLDSFEYADIPVFHSHSTVVSPNGEKWRLNLTDIAGGNRVSDPLSTTTDESAFGDRSLHIRTLEGTDARTLWQAFLYNNYSDQSVNNWQYLNQLFENGFPENKINRIRAWIKFPSGAAASSIGTHHYNFNIGTFIRDASAPVAVNESSQGGHYYHYYHLQYEGDTWHQIIIDAHPDHKRGANGSVEQATLYEPFPDSDPSKNYFDLMTYFYFDYIPTDLPAPSDFYIDGVELYEEPYDEDIEHIYGLIGVYNTDTNEVVTTWRRNKNLSDRAVSVKYATTSFHENGGFAAHGALVSGCESLVPFNPTFSPNGYNGQECRAQIPQVAGEDFVYIALKHEDEAARFREIRIPLTEAGYPVIGGSN